MGPDSPAFLLVTEAVALENVMRQAHQCPFASHLVDAPQQKLPEPACLFDLTEDRFHDRLARRVYGFSRFGFQLPPHAVHPRRPLRQRPLGTGFTILVMLLSLRGDISFYALLRLPRRFQCFPTLLRAITAVLQ